VTGSSCSTGTTWRPKTAKPVQLPSLYRVSWLNKRTRNKERARCQVRVRELLTTTAGNVPPASRGRLSIGPTDIDEGSLVRSGEYLLTSRQLIYVIKSEGTAYRSGFAFLYHSTDVGFDDLKPETIDLAGGIRRSFNYPATPREHGSVVVELPGGTEVRLVFVPDGVYGDRLVAAANSTQSFFCRAAGALGGDGLPGSPQ
jgi:hypothetical protein